MSTHAIVIGASMGGLCAAAALAPHYDEVTVLDRDRLGSEPGHRRGVPQSKHAHGLQPGGLRALDDLFPGLEADLVSAGAPHGDVGAAGTWTIGGVRFAFATTGASSIGCTRPFLEHRVRARVSALPNVTIREGIDVRGLIAADPARVTGVEVEPTGGGTAEWLSADLVVDASGKGTKLPGWVAALGYPAPAEDRVECRMAYLSRRWKLDPAARTREVIHVITPAQTPHFGVMIAQEDGTHIVTLGGLLDTAPRRDDAAYLEFARALPDQVIADALVGATPVTDLQPSHFPASVRRRYDRMRRFPAGVLAIGDAIASFNPMYGQGMSVAALEAVQLRGMLERGRLDAHKFFAAAHRIEDVAWKISTGGDLRYDDVVGKRTPDLKLMNRYLDRLAAAAHTDATLARQFLLVAGFLARPETFFKPSIVCRVMRGGKAPGRRADTAVAPALERAR